MVTVVADYGCMPDGIFMYVRRESRENIYLTTCENNERRPQCPR